MTKATLVNGMWGTSLS